jgi:hypothetical protein
MTLSVDDPRDPDLDPAPIDAMWERHNRRRRELSVAGALGLPMRRCPDRLAELQARIAENAQGMTTSTDPTGS